ncbi:sigma factor-like helix-turn-helix DNA-binding protein [Streptomyces sp. NPDC001848]|uniref:sigma factor-like helix-turn-helix DNA-binding protein n=1 Tax=Streptomyces sp. NPDC001848 TaxID=3364618 RepID=UPI00367D819B
MRQTLTPHQSFDALYEYCAPALARQAYLLTGRRDLARAAVERAFELAWQRWPEVAVDRDPPGWVRAAVHDRALSPWHRFRLHHRRPEPPPPGPADRALLHALLKLPPTQRRALLLYDGLGLGLPDVAAETEASTPATAGRLLRAHATLARLVPDQAAPDVLPRRLAELASSERLRAAKAPSVRSHGERRTRHCTHAAIALTVAVIGATTLTLRTAANHYEPPVGRGTPIHDIPPPPAQGPLSSPQTALRTKLMSAPHQGPARLTPQPR